MLKRMASILSSNRDEAGQQDDQRDQDDKDGQTQDDCSDEKDGQHPVLKQGVGQGDGQQGAFQLDDQCDDKDGQDDQDS